MYVMELLILGYPQSQRKAVLVREDYKAGLVVYSEFNHE
jgi:hypothetical protein